MEVGKDRLPLGKHQKALREWKKTVAQERAHNFKIPSWMGKFSWLIEASGKYFGHQSAQIKQYWNSVSLKVRNKGAGFDISVQAGSRDIILLHLTDHL